ncbi:MAG: hypothetical protein J6U17_05815 [Kiritimatiellae bacterium]|nr:hypothetical protein [Kiritimatiellia bacterium]
MKKLIAVGAMLCATALFADVYIIDGQRVEGEVHEEGGVRTLCTDELCMVLPEDAVKVEDGEGASGIVADIAVGLESGDEDGDEEDASVRIREGYMDAKEFIAFLNGEDGGGAGSSSLAGKSWWLVLVLVLFGGLCMNLTPCVLPMVPINLMVIGKSAVRGALYGLGIAIAYGALGLLAALGGMAFGEIQGSPWFNAAIAVLFVLLALALMDVFFIDLSGRRGGFAQKKSAMLPGLFAFFMGMVSAVLAGACVAPILIAVLLLTADLSAQGSRLALLLPFLLGIGMALPWPFAGAGMQVLPKPGAWMKTVNKVFGAIVLGFAAWYGYLAYRGFAGTAAPVPAASDAEGDGVIAATPATFDEVFNDVELPVLVDCWASWCKNCAAMEATTLADGEVRAALARYTVVRLQAEDIRELKKLEGFEDVRGLPAFVIFE